MEKQAICHQPFEKPRFGLELPVQFLYIKAPPPGLQPPHVQGQALII